MFKKLLATLTVLFMLVSPTLADADESCNRTVQRAELISEDHYHAYTYAGADAYDFLFIYNMASQPGFIIADEILVYTDGKTEQVKLIFLLDGCVAAITGLEIKQYNNITLSAGLDRLRLRGV